MTTPLTPIDLQRLEALVILTDQLTALIANQARAFEQHRPQGAAASLPEVNRLANVYRVEAAKARLHPEMVAKAPPTIRAKLIRATEAFDAVLERQGRALAACRTVTEGLVKAIADEIAAKRSMNTGYGPGATRSSNAAATAITLNRRA